MPNHTLHDKLVLPLLGVPLYAKSNCKDSLEMHHLGVGVSEVKNAQRDSCLLHKDLCKSQGDAND